MQIEQTVVIARPVEEVWWFVSDGRNDPQWCAKVLAVDQTTGEGPGSGATYRVVHRPVRLRRPKDLAVTIEEFDPPRWMRLREEDADGVFDVTYELEGTAEGTRLTQRDQIEWKIPKFQIPMARTMVSRHIRRQLSTLRRLLETRRG
jgi:hypothetical protein